MNLLEELVWGIAALFDIVLHGHVNIIRRLILVCLIVICNSENLLILMILKVFCHPSGLNWSIGYRIFRKWLLIHFQFFSSWESGGLSTCRNIFEHTISDITWLLSERKRVIQLVGVPFGNESIKLRINISIVSKHVLGVRLRHYGKWIQFLMDAFLIFFRVAHTRLSSKPIVHVSHNDWIVGALGHNRRTDIILINNTVINVFLVFKWWIWHAVSLY